MKRKKASNFRQRLFYLWVDGTRQISNFLDDIKFIAQIKDIKT